MLCEFIEANRDEVIARARALVVTRPWPAVSSEELVHGLPLFLTQLTGALRVESGPAREGDVAIGQTAIGQSATLHARELSSQGFTVSQVVHDYGDVCQSITALATELEAPISADEFHTLNHCLDTAIAESVTEFARLREEAAAHLEAERLGQVAHELRNKLHTAMLAFHVLKTGTVGVGGSTGAVLGRSLLGLRDLIDTTLAEVRLAAAEPRRDRVRLKDFVDELAVTASLHAEYREVLFKVAPVDPGLVVLADVPLLASALTNLLQNAFKYTKVHGAVSLRTRGEHGRVFLEVEDECGGMPVPAGSDPFRAAQAPRADGRSGLGLGLSICRKAVEANGGQVRTRNLPGQGCIFEIELPAAPPAT